MKKHVKKEKMKLVAQGTYGCLFHPGITCSGNTQSLKFITKLETNKEMTENEYEIGKHLQSNLKDLTNTMFAPILSYCPVSLSEIKGDSIEECEVIQEEDNKNSLISNKIRYVGKDSLEPYLFDKLKKNPKTFFKFVIESHLYLINSLEKLIINNIVHYDLKENNILVDPLQRVPIIIDFGLSFRIDLLKEDSSYKKAFYYFATDYPPWCMEIAIISFIVKKNTILKKETSSDSWSNLDVDVNDLLSIVDDFYETNDIMKAVSSQDIISSSKPKWREYISNSFTGKKGKFIVDTLLYFWKTWDNYAVCGIYLIFLYNACPDYLKEYQKILINYITCLPSERKGVDEFYKILFSLSNEQNIKAIDRNVYKDKYKNQLTRNTEFEKKMYTIINYKP
jgi:serine/threonine protein kinase